MVAFDSDIITTTTGWQLLVPTGIRASSRQGNTPPDMHFIYSTSIQQQHHHHYHSLVTTLYNHVDNHDDDDYEDDGISSESFPTILRRIGGFSSATCRDITGRLLEVGLLVEERPHDNQMNRVDVEYKELLFLARDFVTRPETFSSILISDFQLPPLMAHQVRATVMALLTKRQQNHNNNNNNNHHEDHNNNGMNYDSNNRMEEMDGSNNSHRLFGINNSMSKIRNENNQPESMAPNNMIHNSNNHHVSGINGQEVGSISVQQKKNTNATVEQLEDEKSEQQQPHAAITVQRPLFKSVVVNQRAKQRKRTNNDNDDSNNTTVTTSNDYGLAPDFKTLFPKMAAELGEFYTFMTRPATSSQDDIIRPATASVYMRHAKQFLGWYVATYHNDGNNDNINESNEDNVNHHQDKSQPLSLYTIFPDKEKHSADVVLNFILWLRSTRSISVSYEANLLRGITKLLKFRFSQESTSDPSYGGEKSFDDIPMIREIRKLHRDANKRQRLAPRSSDEKQKWLSWPEYLQVVQEMQKELVFLMKQQKEQDANAKITKSDDSQARKIAVLFQKYLILAIFSSVPDRQRTIRELDIGRNFEKDDDTGCWCIKHAPEDYKTGKAYGERPTMFLAEPLTPWIDDFLAQWRPCLSPVASNTALFVQPRTGKALTQDSVYQIVSRACYHYSGKRTNPHLLRDMLVTHVRESNASEKQLEALALYMGHSIQMQRTSYDRRTLTKKVAPAVELLHAVNSGHTVGGRGND